MEHKQYDYVVLGGGVSGLGFAKRMSDHSKSVLVLEKEDVVGGLSRSVEHNGFYLDYCAHRFHTNNKELLDEVLSLPGLQMEQHIKKSRIFMFGKWLRYPFEIQQLLRAMPLRQSFVCGVSFMYNEVKKRIVKTPPLRSYKEWFIHLYGRPLYEVMCHPYTSKIWRHDPGEISADWANQRFKGENLKKLIGRVAKKLLTLNFSKYDLRDDSLAPDGGPFWYPLRGIQEMCDALHRAATEKGAKVLLSANISAVDSTKKTITFTHNGESHTVAYTGLISTIPLHSYYKLQDRTLPEVKTALGGLKYMDIIFVYLFLDTPQISNDHWLYFPDKDIIFNRAVEFSNWSPKMCPEGKTSVCFDITCFEGDDIWEQSDEKLVEKTIEGCEQTNYLKGEDVKDSLVLKVKYAYPFYDLEYKDKLDTIVAGLEHNDTYLLGRTGIFRYNNSDNSIEMGFALAEQLLDEGKSAQEKSVYDYTNKGAVSY